MANSKALSASGALSFENLLLSAKLVSVTNQNKLYPATNLLDPRKSMATRTTRSFVEYSGYFQYVFDFLAAVSPTVFAIIGSNIVKTSGNGVYLIGADDALLTTNTVIYDTLTLYPAWNDVLRWYLDTPTSGSGAKRYWGIRFYPYTWGSLITDDFFEFGNFWMGNFLEIGHSYDTNFKGVDNATYEESAGGSRFYDRQLSTESASVAMPMTEVVKRQSLYSNFMEFGTNCHMLLDLEAFSTDDSAKGHAQYYGKIDSSLNSKIQMGRLSDIDFDFLKAIN